MPLIEECVKRNLSTILASFKDQSDERRLVKRVEQRREEKRERKLRNGGGGRIAPPASGGGRMRGRPGPVGLAKQLSAALDDWDMGGEVGEGTLERFKRIDDKMTQLDDYKRGRTFKTQFKLGSE